MNKSELVERVAAATGLTKGAAEGAVDVVLDSVMAEVRAGNKVSLFGFGTFNPKSRAARIGRNPQTGAPVKIAASKSVGFSPSAAFKQALNSKGGAKKAAPTKAAGKKAAPAKKSTKKAAKAAKKR